MGNTHNFTAFGRVEQIALEGEKNNYVVNVNSGIGKLGVAGLGQQARINNTGNTTKPSEAYLNGENSSWQYQGDGQQRLFVGGKNNHVVLITSTLTDKPNLNQDDKLVLAGKGNTIIADTGVGNDTVQIKIADGQTVDVEGGAGKNTLLLEKNPNFVWKTKKLNDAQGTVLYTRHRANAPNSDALQTIRATQFQTFRTIDEQPNDATSSSNP
jgi:hypothetical protein